MLCRYCISENLVEEGGIDPECGVLFLLSFLSFSILVDIYSSRIIALRYIRCS